MILIATASFPQTSVKQAAKIYGEMMKLPTAIRRYGPYFQVEPGHPLQVIAVYETDAAVEQEVQKFLEKRYAVFSDIPGFTCKIGKWLNLPDAVARLAKTPIASGS